MERPILVKCDKHTKDETIKCNKHTKRYQTGKLCKEKRQE